MKEQVLAALKRSEYSVARTAAELEAVHRLRYKCYLAEGAIEANDRGLMEDPFDTLENCVNITIKMDGEMQAAVRLHVVTKSMPLSPTLSVFPEARSYLDAGLTILDPTRFVVDPSARQKRVPLHFLGVRVPLLATMFYDTDLCLIPVRPAHAPFYSRYFHSEMKLPPRPFLGLTTPLQLMITDVRHEREAILERTPAFGPIPDLPMSDVPFPRLRHVAVASGSDSSDAA